MSEPLTRRSGLAIDGGTPVRTTPLPTALGGALIGEEEKAAVLAVLESRSLFRYYGPDPQHMVATFEKEFAAWHGLPNALAVTSGTAALRAGFAALQLPPGAEVLMPAYSFLACATAAITCGLVPVFVECGEDLLLDPLDLERRRTDRTRAVLVVHTNGAAADPVPILEFARSHDLFVIEDCAQACGATIDGRLVGTFGDVATFSLQYLKAITAGEGGVVSVADPERFTRAVFYHDLGFQRPGRDAAPVPGENLRMSELTGAVALAQARKLPAILARMRAHHRRLRDGLAGRDELRVRAVPDPDGDQGSCLVLQFGNAEQARFFRRALRAENVPCDGCHAKLCYGYPVVRDHRPPGLPAGAPAPYGPGTCPRTEAILERSVSIVVSPALTDGDVDDVLTAVVKVAEHLPEG